MYTVVKIMKKIKFFILFMVFVSLFISYDVYAEDYESANYNTDVILKEIDDQNDEYNYDLVWDNMIFTYTESKAFIYNETTHEYDLNISKYWSDADNKVNITNNSYKMIDVSLLYRSQELYNNVVGKFTPNNFKLYYKESNESKLNLYGKIDNKDTNSFTIGTITIKIQ